MRTTTRNNNPQTAIRFRPKVLSRAKEAARLSNLSLNEFINDVVEKATEDIRTPEEIEEERKRTEEFMGACAGSWTGDESVEDIMHLIKDGSVSKEIIKL